MRLGLLFSITIALAAVPLVACEFHAEAGSPPATPSATPASTTTAPAATTPAPAATPTVPTGETVHPAKIHRHDDDAGA